MTTLPHRRQARRAGLRLVPACAAACALLAAAPGARADDPNPYTLGVLETVSHDSNVFRAPDGGYAPADWISTTGLVGSIDQPIGRERLKANLEFDLNRFKHQTQLDSSAHSLSLEGDWATVDNLFGELGYADSSQLYRYSLDSAQTQTAKNTLDTRSGFARFHLGGVTKLTFDAIFHGLEQDYSSDVFRYRDLRRWDGSLGVTYQSSPDLRTSLSYRRTRGDYPHYQTELDTSGNPVTVPDHFTRNDVVFGLSYNASGASQLRLNLSSGHEDHSLITSRSSHNWAADGQWIWSPTGRTQLTLDFVRDNDTGSEDVSFFGLPLASTDARERTAVTAKVSYELTAKIRVDASGSWAKRDLDTAFAQLPAAGSRGSDRLYQASLGFTWLPTRALQFGCSATKEQRTVRGDSVAVVTYPYHDNLLSCTGQFAFN